MQWFVKEQTEEETLALNLLDKILKLPAAKMQIVILCIRLTATLNIRLTMQHLPKMYPPIILKSIKRCYATQY